MKRILFFIPVIFIGIHSLFAQQVKPDNDLCIDGFFNESYKQHQKGDTFKLTRVVKRTSKSSDISPFLFALEIGGQQYSLPYDDIKSITLTPRDAKSYWQYVFIQNRMYQYYDDRGSDDDLWHELDEESITYVQDLANANFLYGDAYMEDYLQSLFAGITPGKLDNRRPMLNGVRILKSPAPDSYMLPNGTLIVTTGLLATLESEEELVAILACELAHYVLDHSVSNVRKAEVRARRIDFWGDIAFMLTSAGETNLSNKYEHYLPGTLTVGASCISAAIVDKINKRMGMDYTESQLKIADRIAVNFLKLNQMNPEALAAALNKIQRYYMDKRDYYALSYNGSFYLLDKRLKSLGASTAIKDRAYCKRVSGVVAFNAMAQLTDKNFDAARNEIKKNIDNKLATGDDYIIFIKANMGLYNTPETNVENMELLEKVMSMNESPNINAYKLKILLLLRMDKQNKAVEAIKEYIGLLSQYEEMYRGSSDLDWVISEMDWANRLLTRIYLI